MPTDAALPTPDGEPAEVPDYTLVHLSDTHLTSTGVLYNRRIDADAALQRVVSAVRSALDNGQRLDAVVASGDLTDAGDPDAYRRLRGALEPLGLPIVYATGNHDVRSVFHRELLGIDGTEPLVRPVLLGGRLRVVAVDSTVVGAGNGRLTGGTLDALREVLSDPAPDGSVVVLHHAPLPPPTPLLVYFALDRWSRRALADVLAGTDTRLVLAGHHHIAQSGMLGAVPVAVAPSTAIRTDPLAAPGWERTTRSSGFNLVRIYPDTVTTTVIPVDGAEEVFHVDPAGCARLIAAHPAIGAAGL